MTTSGRSAAIEGSFWAIRARLDSPCRAMNVTHRSWPQIGAGPEDVVAIGMVEMAMRVDDHRHRIRRSARAGRSGSRGPGRGSSGCRSPGPGHRPARRRCSGRRRHSDGRTPDRRSRPIRASRADCRRLIRPSGSPMRRVPDELDHARRRAPIRSSAEAGIHRLHRTIRDARTARDDRVGRQSLRRLPLPTPTSPAGDALRLWRGSALPGSAAGAPDWDPGRRASHSCCPPRLVVSRDCFPLAPSSGPVVEQVWAGGGERRATKRLMTST